MRLERIRGQVARQTWLRSSLDPSAVQGRLSLLPLPCSHLGLTMEGHSWLNQPLGCVHF